jgi:uncharacterized protein (TIGR03066 family)
MRKTCGFGLALLVICGLSGCGGSNKPQDLIVGKWEMKEKMGDKEITGTSEFTSDGNVKVDMMGIKMEGKYKFIDDKTIEVSMGGQKEKNKIDSITKEKMVLIDPKGKKAEFTRAK